MHGCNFPNFILNIIIVFIVNTPESTYSEWYVVYSTVLAEQQPVGRWARTRKYETARTMKTIGNCA